MGKLSNLFSIDVGNKNIKGVGSKGDVLIVPNVISYTDEPLQIQTSFFREKKEEAKDSIDVMVDGEHIQLGNMAIKNDGLERKIAREKNDDKLIRKQVAIMAAFNALMNENKNVSEIETEIFTNLPIREFKKAEKIENFKETISGETEVEFLKNELAGCKVKVKIRKDQVNVFPEGPIGLYNILTTNKNEIRKEYEKLVGKIVVIIDIGGGTVDIAAVEIVLIDGNIELAPVSQIIDYMSEGVLNAEERIIEDLRLNHDYEISISDLDSCILENESVLDGAEGIDIIPKVEKELTGLARRTQSRVENKIKTTPKHIQRAIEMIFITGGGSVVRANKEHDSVAQKIVGDFIGQGYEVITSSDPLKDNINGCKKIMLQAAAQKSELAKAVRG